MTTPTDTPHKWVPSRVGHGEQQCEYCLITNREAAILDCLNRCDEAPTDTPPHPALGVEELVEMLTDLQTPESPMHPIGCATWEAEALVAMDLAAQALTALAGKVEEWGEHEQALVDDQEQLENAPSVAEAQVATLTARNKELVDGQSRLFAAIEPLALLVRTPMVNLADPLCKWFTVAQLYEADAAQAEASRLLSQHPLVEGES